MAVITPVGKFDFEWSPKETQNEMVKTASAKGESTTESPKEVVAEKSDKDLLYEAAKKVVQAQFDDSEVDEAEETVEEVEGAEGAEGAEGVEESAEVIEDEVEEVSDSVDAGSDVQEAVAELVEKAEAADDVAEAIEVAVEAVEEAVQGVKDAVNGGSSEEAIVELDEEGDTDAIVEVDIVDDIEEGGEDIIQESDECCGAFAESDKAELQKEAGADDLVKTSKISPTTRKKVLKFWKDDLGYVADYAKLMTTNFEK